MSNVQEGWAGLQYLLGRPAQHGHNSLTSTTATCEQSWANGDGVDHDAHGMQHLSDWPAYIASAPDPIADTERLRGGWVGRHASEGLFMRGRVGRNVS